MLDEALATETIGEKTYRRIRTDIVFGRLKPGERLTWLKRRHSLRTDDQLLGRVGHLPQLVSCKACLA